jgi:hypothetical protein
MPRVEKRRYDRHYGREAVRLAGDPKRKVKSDLHILRGIDPAYVYVPQDKNAFLCLGKKLNLERDVSVEKITLPDKGLHFNVLPWRSHEG